MYMYIQILIIYCSAMIYIHVDPDDYVQKNVATLIREITKHTPEVSTVCVKSMYRTFSMSHVQLFTVHNTCTCTYTCTCTCKVLLQLLLLFKCIDT